MMEVLNIVLLLVGCASLQQVNGDLITDEMRLFDFIMKSNNPDVRPVQQNISQTTRVNFGIALISILDLDELKGILTSQVWTRMLWHDEHIKWNVTEFGGIDKIRFPADKIWQPDIVLYNAAESGGTKFEEALAVVSFDGTVFYIPPMIMKSKCSVDMTYFPYDRQLCSMKFGSWTYDGFKVDLDFYDGIEEIDVADYIMSAEWQLDEVPAKKNEKYYSCCVEPYPDLTFFLKLTRRAGLQAITYIAPIVILAILCPFIFLLPYSERQRFSLGGSLLICLAIMLSSFDNIFPSAHGTTPVLASYYISVVILLVLSLIMSAIITNLAAKATGPHTLPRIIKKIFIDGLGKVVCISSANYALMNNEENPEEGSTGQKRSTSGSTDWRVLAVVLDRVLFIVYVILTVVLSFAFLCRA